MTNWNQSGGGKVEVNDGTMTYWTDDLEEDETLESVADDFASDYDFNGFDLSATETALTLQVSRGEESDQFSYLGSYFSDNKTANVINGDDES